jgi:hypothetical protein
MGRTCSTHGRDEKCIKVLVGKPERKRRLGRPRRRWEDNIRMDLTGEEVCTGCVSFTVSISGWLLWKRK